MNKKMDMDYRRRAIEIYKRMKMNDQLKVINAVKLLRELDQNIKVNRRPAYED